MDLSLPINGQYYTIIFKRVREGEAGAVVTGTTGMGVRVEDGGKKAALSGERADEKNESY